MEFTYPNHPTLPNGFHLVGTEGTGRWYPSPSESGVTVDKVWAARVNALRVVTVAVRAVKGVLAVDDRMSRGSIAAQESLHLLVHFQPGTPRRRSLVEAAIRRALNSLEA